MVFEAAILAVTMRAVAAPVDSAVAGADSSHHRAQTTRPAVADSTLDALTDTLRSIASEIQRIEGLMSQLHEDRQRRDAPRVTIAAPDNMPVIVPDVSTFRMPLIAPVREYPMPILTPEGWRVRPRAIDSTAVESADTTQAPRE